MKRPISPKNSRINAATRIALAILTLAAPALARPLQQEDTVASQQSRQVGQQAADDRQEKISQLQSEIDQLNDEAKRWDAEAKELANTSNCSGQGASACQSIGNMGAAKARQNAAKTRQQAQADRQEISRLQRTSIPSGSVDTSYGVASPQQSQQRSTSPTEDSPWQQQSAVRAAAAANQASQQSNPTPATNSGEPHLPMPQAGPVVIVITHSANWGQGSAHVVSSLGGINCPSSCSYYFAKGDRGSVTATADSRSIIHRLNCGFYETGGGTAPYAPGNSWSCGLSSVDSWNGTTITVYVDAIGTYTGQVYPAANGGISGPPYGLNCGGFVTSNETCPTSRAATNSGTIINLNGTVSIGGTSGAPGTSSVGGLNPKANTGGCAVATNFVTATVKVASDGFVVGYLTNHSNQTLYVSYTFARGGKPYGPDTGATTIRPGQTAGGELGGIWASGNVDTNPPRIFWYAVLQSDENAGKNCSSAW